MRQQTNKKIIVELAGVEYKNKRTARRTHVRKFIYGEQIES